MESTNFAVQAYVSFVLYSLVAALWYVYIFDYRERTLLRLLLFSMVHFQALRHIRKYPAAFVVGLFHLYILTFILESIFWNKPLVFLFCWALIDGFELFAMVAYLLGRAKGRTVLCATLLIAAFVAVGAIRSAIFKDYRYMDNVDFVEAIILFSGSLYVVTRITLKDVFWQNLEAFFVFFGFIIYSFLCIVGTVPGVMDFLGNYSISFAVQFISMLFWLGCVPWILHLRRKAAE